MTAAVAVELAAADARSPHAHALLDTCSVGAQTRARCVLSQDVGVDDQRVATAIVSWNGPARVGARVDVGLQMGARMKWRARELFFSSADPEVERWRTVGFAIATLVGNLLEHDESASQAQIVRAAEVPSSARSERPPPQPSRDSGLGAWIDAVFSVGTGAASAPAFGGELRFSRMLDSERWSLTGAAQCAVQWLDEDRISIVRPAGSLGIGVTPLRLARRINFALRMEAMLQLVQVTGTDALSGASGEGARWLPGLKQGVDGAWMGSSMLGLVASVQATEVLGATDIRAHDRLVAHLPAVDFMGQGGVRLAFP
jgi:hypothetical protein